MEVTMKGAKALRHLRQKLQEDAGEDFPNGISRELLVLYDVCKFLDLNIFEAKDVLGECGWQYVASYINAPTCNHVNWQRIRELGIEC